MLESFSLEGKKALVTGGSRGIGLGMALGLAKAGAAVCIVGRDEARNAPALAELRKVNPRCSAAAGDLEDTGGIEGFYDRASDAAGPFDILVNNAGMTLRARADQMPLADWDRLIRVNLTAPLVLSQCFGRQHIAAGKPGCIIVTASLMSQGARPTTAGYAATKGGIRQLIKALAIDWAPFHIRVNGIGPGYIRTDLTQPLQDNPDFDAWVKQRTPLKRWGTPEDFAGAAVFLASDSSAFVTGQILYVDGGWLAAL